MAKLVMKREPKDNKYLHKDFHISLDNGLTYVGNNYGQKAVIELVENFSNQYYKPLFEDFEKRGLIAIKDWIEKTYQTEEATDAVELNFSDNELAVKINYCPAVKYMMKTGKKPSEWYVELTRTVNAIIAKKCGLKFIMGDYDQDTGKTDYIFKV